MPVYFSSLNAIFTQTVCTWSLISSYITMKMKYWR